MLHGSQFDVMPDVRDMQPYDAKLQLGSERLWGHWRALDISDAWSRRSGEQDRI